MNFINLHTHSFTASNSVMEVVNQYPLEFNSQIPYYSIGIHPWKIMPKTTDSELQIIEQKIQTAACIAIGECGLDKRIDTELDLQIDLFKKQIYLAEKYKKPIIIHCVAAHQELIEIKKKCKVTVPMIVHGFSKNEQLAKQLLAHGFYLSFGKYLMQNTDVMATFKSVPTHGFFLETDSSAYTIQSIYDQAALIKGLDLVTLQKQVQLNFKSVFNI